MGRPRSCFQIITCGSDSKDGDEIDKLESKDSRDKRGWSFSKRSSQHRVLNNTVTAETSPVEKENLETATIDFQSSANATVPEKPTIIHFANEETNVSNIENPKGSDKVDFPSENENKVDSEVEESSVIVIQAGIRGILAQGELLKLKNVVKVQAAVRGFLVRTHAVGTLRCAQAIVKMQAIVRARRALERSAQDELCNKNVKENSDSRIAVKGEMTKSNSRYVSIEKLLTNSFARQLLESTPRNKPINIKCVPSKNDSAWKWLEIWLAGSSMDVSEGEKELSITEQMEREPDEPNKEEPDTEQMQREIEESHVEDRIESKAFSETEDLNSSIIKSVSPSQSEDTYDAGILQSQTCPSPSFLVKDNLEQPTSEEKETPTKVCSVRDQKIQLDDESLQTESSSVKDNLEQPRPENSRTFEEKGTPTKVGSVQDQKIQLDDESLQTESSSSSDKPQMDMEQVNPLKRLAPEQLENEGKKVVLGSRKASNPTFINAQAKFEQLSLAPDSFGTISSMHQDDGFKSHSEAVLSTSDTVLRTNEPSAYENIVLPGSSIIQLGGSECTELSISPTLDSPDRSEVGLADPHANDVSKKGVQDQSTEAVIKDSSATIQNDVQLLVGQPEEASESNDLSISSVAVVDSAPSESKLERSSSDQQREHNAGQDRKTDRSSPKASPRSHLTVAESQGTPSSQVSVKAKRDKTDKTVSYQKQKSSSPGKKSPSSLNRNSAGRSSTENSQKDQKTGKRRNSFDSARPEIVEKELKESSSSNSLPRFMQATESARAKLHSTNSPRSSPDVYDRETYIMKRHSLPAEGLQRSPRVQQPASQTQQGAKGNEKMWRR